MTGLIEIKKMVDALNKAYPKKPFLGDKPNNYLYDKKYFYAKWDSKQKCWDLFCIDFFLYLEEELREITDYLSKELKAKNIKMGLHFAMPVTLHIFHKMAIEKKEAFLL